MSMRTKKLKRMNMKKKKGEGEKEELGKNQISMRVNFWMKKKKERKTRKR